MNKAIFVTLILMLSSITSFASMKTLLEVLPASIFNNTSEGVSKEEWSLLGKSLDSENWKITVIKSNQLSIQCKHPSSSLHLFAYPMGENRVVLIYTDNGGSSYVQTWVFNSAERTLSKKQLLPKVSINEFYAKADKLLMPERYSGNIIVTLEPDGTLVYEINSWMNELLEKKMKTYDVSAVWNGEQFTLKQKRVTKAYKTFY